MRLKKHMAEFAFLSTITNGPDFVMVKKNQLTTVAPV